MKLPRFSIALIGLAFVLVSLSTPAQEPTRAAKREMKGIKLYSWPDNSTHQWNFVLMPGTNRNKTTAEIKASRNTLKTLEELKTRLATLAVGEYVFWDLRVDSQQFSLPPQEQVQQITAYCEARKLKLSILNNPPKQSPL